VIIIKVDNHQSFDYKIDGDVEDEDEDKDEEA
jgi:hypothetical protein